MWGLGEGEISDMHAQVVLIMRTHTHTLEGALKETNCGGFLFFSFGLLTLVETTLYIFFLCGTKEIYVSIPSTSEHRSTVNTIFHYISFVVQSKNVHIEAIAYCANACKEKRKWNHSMPTYSKILSMPHQCHKATLGHS